jgi:hypothetical protein
VNGSTLRLCCRKDQFVDARNIFVRVDEQPFPVEGDHLHFGRLALRLDGPEWIEQMRADPDHAGEEEDDEERNSPDQELQTAGIDPVGQIGCARIAGAKPPGKCEGGANRRHHDGKHDTQRIEHDLRIARADRSARLEHAAGASAE